MELGPTALVVRGGASRDVAAIVELIRDAVEDGDGPVLSVYCGNPEPGEAMPVTLQRICALADIPHSKVLFTTAGQLAAIDLTLESDTSDGQAPNHYHARFHLPVEESQVQDFIACLTGPIPNPTGGKKGRGR